MRQWTPSFTIYADGNDMTGMIRDRLISMSISDAEGNESDRLNIVLDDRDGRIMLPRTGAELSISLGYLESDMIDMGAWIVSGLTLSGSPDSIAIDAIAANYSSRTSKGGKSEALRTIKTRAWDNISVADICQTIATEHGLTSRVSAKYAKGSPPAIGAPITHLDQREESDLNFLTRLGDDYGAVCKPVRDYLLFVEKSTAISATGRVLDAVSITPNQLTRWSVSLNDRGKYVAATAYYHDQDTATRMAVRVGDASGLPVASSTGTFADEQAALAAATTRLEALNRGTIAMDMTLPGNALIASGTPLDVTGFRDGINRRYITKETTHTLAAGGFRTTLKCAGL